VISEKINSKSYALLDIEPVTYQGFRILFLADSRIPRLEYRLGTLIYHYPKQLQASKVYDILDHLLIRVKNKYAFIPAVDDQFCYVFGEKKSLRLLTNLGRKSLKTALKKLIGDYINERVFVITKELKLPAPIKIVFRDTTRKWGSFHLLIKDKSYYLSFALSLVHFRKEIIDSVIYHEITHYYYLNHSKVFYQKLQLFNPEFKLHQEKLNAGKY
jgi:predicted metal-dependent hydrolase